MRSDRTLIGKAYVASEAIALRRRFLMTIISFGLAWGAVMQVPAMLGIAPLGAAQTRNNLLFLILSAGVLAMLWRWPRSFGVGAVAYFTAAFVYVSAAQFLVVEDQLRMLLYFPLIGAVFLIVGNVGAWFTILAAIAVFVTARLMGLIPVSPLAVSTFVFTLGVTGAFFEAFSRQMTRTLDTIARQNEALEAAAKKDHLTHLLNLRAFRESMQAHVDGLRPDSRFSVAFIDVDHFKAINDRHGHAVGDAMLVALADTLKGAVRKRDEVARIGGEEFAVLLPGADLAEAAVIAERMRAAVAATRVEAGGTTLGGTVSIGLAAYDSSFDTIDALLHAADAAMYEAKKGGRNRVALAGPAAISPTA
ncbi:GGDEF domain-containing protein [Sphingoaurantiacus capsulatus]|uniref:diguanylate cyclase n=1 Tax=Sphingoaurantiacus capsulatus TaxID=1771310 RepID=A0ABV7X736_9SPHN